MTNIIGAIINDCHDDLARTRQELRFTSLFGVTPTFAGVASYDSVEAGGTLADLLDVLTQFPVADTTRDAVILVNAAPRGEDVQERWDNGTPFCYFRVGRVLVVGTYEGRWLALVRDLGIANEVELLDIPAVTAAAVERSELTAVEASKINNSQFRSLEFLPLVAYWLHLGKDVPSEKRSLAGLPSASGLVWHVDNFGNAKTTLRAADVDFVRGQAVTLVGGLKATCYERLADVPAGTLGLTIGSSGYGPHRFLELAVGQHGRAADEYGLAVGVTLLGNKVTDKVQ